MFHVCLSDRRESFLCPLGTIFNQALLACDYWYSSNCSLAPHYYAVNAENMLYQSKPKSGSLSSMINVLIDKENMETSSMKPDDASGSGFTTPTAVASFISQFIPVKAKVVVYPGSKAKPSKIVATASVGEKTKRKVLKVDFGSGAKGTSGRVLQATALIDKGESKDEKQVADLKYKIVASRLNQTLDRVLEDVKTDNSIVQFYDIVENVVKFIKGISNVAAGPKTSSEKDLYEYDQKTVESFKILPSLLKDFLRKIPHQIEERKESPALKVSEPGVPITFLDENTEVTDAESTEAESDEEDTYTEIPEAHTEDLFVVRPLKSKSLKKVKISRRTKNALVKNYIKLINAKDST